jgi:succinate dehydrogenase/fumarate reductase cytochrome b subunit
MAFFKKTATEIINFLFQSLLVAYLILFLLEQLWPGAVSFYLNLNYLLAMVIVVGVLDVFSEHKKIKESPANWRDYGLIYGLGTIGFIIIKIKTGELGWLSWLISIIAGIFIILLSVLVLEDKGNQDE